MKVRLHHLWEVASSGYWFVPSVMTAAAGAMALITLYIDRHYLGWNARVGWLYSGGSAGAGTLLSTVAGSIITVAAVVFSITIAALTQASAQFGPRLLRNFMRDTGNQVVLGTFVSTFLFCLLVLRTIHGKIEDGVAFVPQASVTVAVLLTVASIAVLIYFIHHVSVSLQAPSVVAAVRVELSRALDQLAGGQDGVSEPMDRLDANNGVPSEFEAGSRAVTCSCDGYIQAVDYDTLMQTAEKYGLLIRLQYRAGDYMIAGNPLLHAWPAGGCNEELSKRLNDAFICGDHRTPEQDVEYSIRQMVEIAVRALSPGINDPFTAINCIDALGSAVCRIARGGLPGPYRHDAAGKLRLISPVSTFAGIADAAFNQIRQYGCESVAVTVRLLEIFRACAVQVRSDDQRKALMHHAEMVYRQGQTPEAIAEKNDRDDVRRCWEAFVKTSEEAEKAER